MMENLEAKLEAILFMYGEPLSIKMAAKILEINEDSARETIEKLQKQYEERRGGLILTIASDNIQLTTKAVFSDLIQKLLKAELQEELTPAAIETLAILAYAGPLGRSDLEYIRGVNSAYIIRNLMLRGLITKQERKYSVSIELLKNLGLTKLDQLPEYQQYQELIVKFLNKNNEI